MKAVCSFFGPFGICCRAQKIIDQSINNLLTISEVNIMMTQVCTQRSWCWWTRGQWCWLFSCWIYITVTSVVRSQRGCALWRSRASLVYCACTRNSKCLSTSIAFNSDENRRRRPPTCNRVTLRTSDLDPVYTRYNTLILSCVSVDYSNASCTMQEYLSICCHVALSVKDKRFCTSTRQLSSSSELRSWTPIRSLDGPWGVLEKAQLLLW